VKRLQQIRLNRFKFQSMSLERVDFLRFRQRLYLFLFCIGYFTAVFSFIRG